jgi:hypothetical protein
MKKNNNNNNESSKLSVADQSVLAVRNLIAIYRQNGLSRKSAESLVEKECPSAFITYRVYEANGFRLGKY